MLLVIRTRGTSTANCCVDFFFIEGLQLLGSLYMAFKTCFKLEATVLSGGGRGCRSQNWAQLTV